MEEHRFCYPIVIPVQPGASAHGPRAASLEQDAAQVRPAAGEYVRSPADAQLRPSTAHSPWSHPQLRAAFGGHGS